MKICPTCHGRGVLGLKSDPMVKIIHTLRKKGLSIRRIARAVGFKSPNTIIYYLKKTKSW